MACQILSFSRPANFPGAATAPRFSSIRETSVREGKPSNYEMETRSPASAAGLGCIRGTTLALTFEAVAAVLIYAAWHFLRLLH